MSIVTTSMTAEELIKLPRGKVRYELVKGELLTMSPTGSEHGLVTFRLSGILDQFLQKNELGLAFGAETGFLIHRDPDTVRTPDIAFIRRERVPDGDIKMLAGDEGLDGGTLLPGFRCAVSEIFAAIPR